MFGENQFYHGTVKKSIVAFGNLFSDIYINNYDPATGKAVRKIKCPISFAPKQQWFQRLREDPDFQKKFETELPRISFEITGYQYLPEKKLGNQANIIMQNCGVPKATYNPVPWRLSIDLATYCKNQDDSLQILEQILPYFQPALNVNIEVLPDFNLHMDFPIILTGVHSEDNYQDLQNNRMIIQTFSYNMDIQLFGPTDTNLSQIKEANVDVTMKITTTEQPDTTYNTVVDPRTANVTDPHTIDENWTVL